MRVKAAIVGISAVCAIALGGCSMEVIVTPAARADAEWDGLSPSEQRQLCDLHGRDSDTFREITFQSLRSELGWTNETSMWEYWIVLTSHCETESRETTAPATSPTPTPSGSPPVTPTSRPADAESEELGASGYPAKDEEAYLTAVRSDPILGEIGRSATDEALFYVAVPICVSVRDENAPIKEVKQAMKSVDLDPRYIPPLIEVSLTYLCPE